MVIKRRNILFLLICLLILSTILGVCIVNTQYIYAKADNIETLSDKKEDDALVLPNLNKAVSGEGGFTNVKYIDNADYFLVNPRHHTNIKGQEANDAGVCTTVAMQMLMGYHNYYSDP